MTNKLAPKGARTAPSAQTFSPSVSVNIRNKVAKILSLRAGAVRVFPGQTLLLEGVDEAEWLKLSRLAHRGYAELEAVGDSPFVLAPAPKARPTLPPEIRNIAKELAAINTDSQIEGADFTPPEGV